MMEKIGNFCAQMVNFLQTQSHIINVFMPLHHIQMLHMAKCLENIGSKIV